MKINMYDYWTEPPPEQSPRVQLWLNRFKSGWKPNRRIQGMGWEETTEFFGVYAWEYFNILYPKYKEICK